MKNLHLQVVADYLFILLFVCAAIFKATWQHKLQVTPITTSTIRQAFLKNRCLIPVSGYFEWVATGRTKQPYFIRKKDRSMFALAGLWEGGTFGILTRSASHITGVVHPRMPLIIPADFYVTWMNYKTPIAELNKILLINFEENLEIYPVSTRMNNAKFEDPACILALQ